MRTDVRIATAAIALVGLCAYTAPNKQFHIDDAPPVFTVDKELVTGANTFVSFKFTSPSRDATGERFVVWRQVLDLIPQPEDFAQKMTEAVLTDRYAAGHFAIDTKAKARDANGQLYYIFTAKGLYRDSPAVWTGIVRFFPLQGVALTADVHSLKGQETRDQLGLTDAEILTWGTSLKPGE